MVTHSPWELPIGWGDEFGNKLEMDKGRGLSTKLLMPHSKFSMSCHKDIPQGRVIYRVIARVGDSLGLVPKAGAAQMKLIGKAMFIAAIFQIFGR